jgi:predicted RNA-binding protein with PIN domain
MKILIDGYNLIFAWGWMPNTRHQRTTADARSRMVKKLKPLVPVAFRSHFTFVFDVKSTHAGQHLKSGPDSSGFEFLFAKDYPDADTMMEALIQADPAPEHLLVVSSDQRIKTAAARRRVETISSRDFLDAIAQLVARLQFKSSAVGEQQLSQTYDSNLLHTSITRDTFGDKLAVQTTAESMSAIRSLMETDWLAEFGFTEPEPSATKQDLTDQFNPALPSKLSNKTDDSSIESKLSGDVLSFDNPFPEGYAEDLLKDS